MNNRSRTILVGMAPETSAMMATFKIARSLTQRGHRIVYLVLADFAPFVASQGFETHIIFEDLFPVGSIKHLLVFDAECKALFQKIDSKSESKPAFSWLAQLKTARSIRKRNRSFFRGRFLHGDIREAINRTSAHLILTDPLISGMSVPALLAGTRVLYLCNAFVQRVNRFTPPTFSNLIPRQGVRSQLSLMWLWQQLLLKNRLRRWTESLFFGGSDQLGWLKQEIRRLRLRMVNGEYGRRLDLPEIMMMPREFDFPALAPNPKRIYMSGTVDLNRKEGDFDWQRLDRTRRLVLCSLGTYTYYPSFHRFCQAVSDAMAFKKEWVLVLNIGNRLTADNFRNVPENVILSNGVPQLSLLRKASLRINQGGTQTIRECVSLGVPMVCFPCQTDQPGTTARVVFHGLGERGDVANASPESISKLIELVGESTSYRNRIESMRSKFLDEDSFERGIRFIEDLASGSSSTFSLTTMSEH